MKSYISNTCILLAAILLSCTGVVEAVEIDAGEKGSVEIEDSDLSNHSKDNTETLPNSDSKSNTDSKSYIVAWEKYRQRSVEWQRVDTETLSLELQTLQLETPLLPPSSRRLKLSPENFHNTFASSSATNIANNILSFQTPSGGWSKGTEMTFRPRKTGEAFGTESKYIPTFDNGATTTQMRFLALVFNATNDVRYSSALVRAINLLLEAQYPNGCWPQTFPLVGSYHDHITFNDNAMVNVLSVLQDIALSKNEFSFHHNFFDNNNLAIIERSVAKGMSCLLDAQVSIDGILSIWGAQHDALTLQPESARAYEMASLASQESQQIVKFLMGQDKPSPRIVSAVHSAMQWFEDARIEGKTWRREKNKTPKLRDKKGATLWSRFYELKTNKPVFGDRDGSIHYDVSEISLERQQRYRWYTDGPEKLFDQYESWMKNVVDPIRKQ